MTDRFDNYADVDLEEYEDELECTHCGGDGACCDGSDPLWDCPDTPHRCHACNGSGRRKDQWVF